MYTTFMDMLVKLIADGMMLPIVVLALYAFLTKIPRADRYQRYVTIFMAGITSYVAAKFIGALWQPETLRPFQKLGVDPGAAYLNNPGFPSDHALFAAFLTFAVWYASRSRVLTGAMIAMTILVCLGRVLALVHTPLDVVGGIAVAAFGALWYLPDMKQVSAKLLAKKSNK
jgi:membrane-associated phospholipid phosphatase